MSIFLYAGGAAGICAVAALCKKGFAWDQKPRLRQVQEEERRSAPEMAAVLRKYFAQLDHDGDGLLRADRETLSEVDHLGASEREMNLLQLALESAGPRWSSFLNPWVFGPFAEYTYEPVGHCVSVCKEQRVAVGQYAVLAMPYEVEVSDYAVSLVDLSTYVNRVNRRPSV
jgi:hypothetical protein